MRDNHTFMRLPADNELAYRKAMDCFDEDGWIMLCGTWSDEGTNRLRHRPPCLHARGREKRTEFAEAAWRWLEDHPSNEKKEEVKP
jgi:hypothetical protein